ncbi:hypothetical protein CsSME_00025299 [Camellia sinensis var. sinensis]
MTSLFRDRSLNQSKRETMTDASLLSPFGDLTPTLSAADLHDTTYEIFVAACRTSSGKSLTYIYSNSSSSDRSSSPSSSSPSMQRSLTSTAASKMKKVLGIQSSSKRSEGSQSSDEKTKKPVTVGELCEVKRERMKTTMIFGSYEEVLEG